MPSRLLTMLNSYGQPGCKTADARCLGIDQKHHERKKMKIPSLFVNAVSGMEAMPSQYGVPMNRRNGTKSSNSEGSCRKVCVITNFRQVLFQRDVKLHRLAKRPLLQAHFPLGGISADSNRRQGEAQFQDLVRKHSLCIELATICVAC